MKIYTANYNSPLGAITIVCSDNGLIGLYFINQNGYPKHLYGQEYASTPIIEQTKKWLDIYFSGREPNFTIPLEFSGTNFQKEVWQILLTIPYGKTITYGEVAKILANKKGLKKMSAQAVGGAVSKNKISIIIPCHRVIGSNGSLTGYAGGLDKKKKLLEFEKII